MHIKSMTLFASTVAFMIAASPVAAQRGRPLQPVQEAFRGELVFPQERGEIQLTLGASSALQRLQRDAGVQLGIEYGITSAWQLQVEWDAFNVASPTGGTSLRGIGDLSAGMKYSWLALRGGPTHLAAGFDVGIPVGNDAKGFSDGTMSLEPFVAIARDAPRLRNGQFFGSIAASFQKSERDAATELDDDNQSIEWNVGLLLPVRRVVFTSEFTATGSLRHPSRMPNTFGFTPGVVTRLKGIDVGAAVPIELRGPRRIGLLAYLIYEFGGD